MNARLGQLDAFTHANHTMYPTSTKADESRSRVRPYGDASMSPAAGVLNHGQGCRGHESLRTPPGSLVFFDRGERRRARGADVEDAPCPNRCLWTPLSRWSRQTSTGFHRPEKVPWMARRC